MFDKKESLLVTKELGLDVYKKFINDYQVVYPFLRVINSEAIFSDSAAEEVTITSTGWIIHDYEDALAVYSYREAKLTDEFVIEHVINAAEFAHILSKKRWGGVELINGSRLMKLLLWLESDRYNFNITNYESDRDDRDCYDSIKEYVDKNNLSWDKPSQMGYNKRYFKSPALVSKERTYISILSSSLDMFMFANKMAQKSNDASTKAFENKMYLRLLEWLEKLWDQKSFTNYVNVNKMLEDTKIIFEKKDRQLALKELHDKISANGDYYIKVLIEDIGEESFDQKILKSPISIFEEQADISRLKSALMLVNNKEAPKSNDNIEAFENEVYLMLLKHLVILWVKLAFDSYASTKTAIEDARATFEKKDQQLALKILYDEISNCDYYIKALTEDINYVKGLSRKSLATEHLLENLEYYKLIIEEEQRSSLMQEVEKANNPICRD